MEATVEYVSAADLHTIVPAPGPRTEGELPDQIKGYRLIRQLGRGGMGTVFEAEDSRHRRRVALKIIAPGHVESREAAERFRQEGRLASTLAHPRCVFVLEADEDGGRPFIAMELMTGDSLRDLVEKCGPLEIGDAVSKILDVVEGLREAHGSGLIHRDVKPSNCFLDGDGRVKVGDFGLAKSLVDPADLTGTGLFVGTPRFASPEQVKAEALDARTDVYSTAATLFFLLTGRAPFDGGNAQATMARIVSDPAPSAREKRPEVPVGLDRAIRKGLERDRERRYQDLDEFRAALLPFAPVPVPAAKVSLRIAACLAEFFLLIVATTMFHDGLLGLTPWAPASADVPLTLGTRFSILFLVPLAYFAIGDGVFGGSPGKRLLRMRVTDTGGRRPAGVPRAALRALLFLTLTSLPELILGLLSPELSTPLFLACLVAWVLGFAVIAATMWASRERRGLHDWLSGTRVVAPPEVERRRFEALRPFAPGLVPAAKVSLRFWAYLADYCALAATTHLLFDVLLGWPFWMNAVVGYSVIMAYWTVGDGIFGASPGKRLLQMRVADASGREAAGAARAALRALVFLLLTEPPIIVFSLDPAGLEDPLSVFDLACLAAMAVGLALLAAPMWVRNQSQGLHDWLAGTRVVALPRVERRRVIARDPDDVSRPVELMEAVGPYKVRGAVRWGTYLQVVSGEDSRLGREAWIVIRPEGSPAPELVRREIARPTRPRWLAGGEQDEARWDAYVAPAGCPIADLAGPTGLPWRDARPILEDLADELAAARAEGTLPFNLTLDQVWVQPDGRALFVDPLAIPGASATPDSPSDDARALFLLRRVAALALEGSRRRSDDISGPVKSPMPLHASSLLGGLFGGDEAYSTVDAFRAELEATRHRPTEASDDQRATQLVILSLLTGPVVFVLFGPIYGMITGRFAQLTGSGSGEPGPTTPLYPSYVQISIALLFCSFIQATWMAWDFLTRGGLSLRLVGLALVRRDGRRAPRWRCAWRSLMTWAPPFALLVASVVAKGAWPTAGWPSWTLFGLAVALLPVYVASALISPSCGPHDRLSGLRVVPR